MWIYEIKSQFANWKVEIKCRFLKRENWASNSHFSLSTFDFGHPLPPSPINSEDLVPCPADTRKVVFPCSYIIFPSLKVFETRIVLGSKCQSRRVRATSTPRMSQNLQNICRNVGFSKRIFENFASGNRLCSRKNGFASGSKLRKRSS